MSFSFTQVKEHLIGMGHGGTLNKVRNVEALFERVIARVLLRFHPLSAIRELPLTSLVQDNYYNYALPSDFGAVIDLIPQDNRQSWDDAFRKPSGEFDLKKAIQNKTISIESKNGTRFIRINWRSRQGKTLNAVTSLTGNGTWAAVAAAANLATDTVTKFAGSGSVRFDVTATGDGIQNTTMAQLDLTTESRVSEIFVPVYLGTDYANLTSLQAVFGNDLTTKYWTTVAVTTQADGSAFQYGWNIIKFVWSTSTQTGTVAPSTIDSFKLLFTSTGTLLNVRVNNIVFSIGRNFDLKYYSKYMITDSTGATRKSRTDTDNDLLQVENDELPIFLYEFLIDMAQQMEGTDSAFDIGFAEKQLSILYPAYKGAYPSMVKKSIGRTTNGARMGRFGRLNR